MSEIDAGLESLMIEGQRPRDYYDKYAKVYFKDKIFLSTLTDLGLKKSVDAESKGYLCIIPHTSTGQRSFPGKWLSPTDRQEFEKIVICIRTAVIKEHEDLIEAQCQEDIAAVAQRVISIEKINTHMGKSLSTECHKFLSSLPLKLNIRDLYSELFRFMKQAVTQNVSTRWDQNKNGNISLRCNYKEQQQWVIPSALYIEPDKACLMLLDSEDELSQYVKDKGEKNFNRLAAKSASYGKIPAWYTQRELLVWCDQIGAKKKSKLKEQHPADELLQRLPHHILKAHDQSVREKDTGMVSSVVQLKIDGELYLVDIRIQVPDLGMLIWNSPAELIDDAIMDAKSKAAERWAKKISTFIAKLDNSTRWDEEKSKIYQYDKKQWGEIIANLTKKIKTPNDENFKNSLQTILLKRRYELQVNECSKALPDNLGDLYPVARSMKRRLKLIIGPTNSGKTHLAIGQIKLSNNSIYLGPLRLLALEVRDRLEAEGVPTSLVTGELIEMRDDARCDACTVEMLDFEKPRSLCVIDEVQMLGDRERGFAWVQAILGAPAQEVWMLGSPESESAVYALAEYLDEPIEVVRLDRLGKLEINTKETKLGNIPKQSAIVAFSRRGVLDIAAELQEKHGRTCAVVYGALSPEVRRQQAHKFSSGEADIIVATDAIGMGLNIPVENLYFSAATKWNGSENEPLAKDLLWQIAGRAGRFGLHEVGHVGALDSSTLSAVRAGLATRPNPVNERFGHGATWPLVKILSEKLASTCLPTILNVFKRDLSIAKDKRFFPSITEDQLKIAAYVDHLKLDLRSKLLISYSPVPMKKGDIPDEFSVFAKAIASGKIIGVNDLAIHTAIYGQGSQERAEDSVKILNLYCWMHYRFPIIFPDFGEVKNHIEILNETIEKTTANKNAPTLYTMLSRSVLATPISKVRKLL